MNIAGRWSALAVFCVLSVSTGLVFAQAKMPQGEFVCQVKDVDGAWKRGSWVYRPLT